MIGAFRLVDALRDCLSSWRRRTVKKPFLNLFGQFNEVNLRDSGLVYQHNAVRFDTAYGGVLVFFPVNGFEVLGECEGRGQRKN